MDLPRIWGISDLHLRMGREAPQNQARNPARSEPDRIQESWREVVRPDDLVLLPGDISLARNHREAQGDLAWLARLPGRKVLSPGNHDTWFNRPEAVRRILRPNMECVCGDAVLAGSVIVCGARGAPVAEETGQGQDAMDREIAALDRALEAALRLRAEGNEPIVVMWHYPPFDRYGQPGPCVDRCESSGVAACLYGHLHAESQWGRAITGLFGKVRYECVAADSLGFRPLRIQLS